MGEATPLFLSEYLQTVFDKFELRVRQLNDRIAKALDWVRKYSLLANSIKPPVSFEPRIGTEA